MSRRVTECQGRADYTLWMRFDDGLDGSVFLGNLLELGAFRPWRDVAVFMSAQPESGSGNVVWPVAGLRLDPDVLWADIAARSLDRSRKPATVLVRHAEPREPAFYRFMARTLEPVKRRRRRN